jgi:hypothetical protein
MNASINQINQSNQSFNHLSTRTVYTCITLLWSPGAPIFFLLEKSEARHNQLPLYQRHMISTAFIRSTYTNLLVFGM